MSYIATIGLTVLLLGILFLVKGRNNKKLIWVGIPVMIAGALMIFTVINKDVDKDLVGMQILKNEPKQFIVELTYFPTKAEALSFYQAKGISEFLLMAKFDGKAKDFYDMINVKPVPGGGKRIAFTDNPKKKESAELVFQDFYMMNKLFTVHSAIKRGKK